jgi:tetratricopeptide (TPR) repeat protein
MPLFSDPIKCDFSESKKLFEEVLKNFPDYKDAEIGLERIQAAEKPDFVPEKEVIKPKKSSWVGVELYERLVEKYPDNPVYLYELGRIYYGKGEWPRAVALFRKALTEDEKNADIKVLLAYTLLFNCLSERAEEAVKPPPEEEKKAQAPEKPPFVKEWLEASEKLRDEKEYEAAAELLQNLIALYPEEADYWYRLGDVYRRAEQPNQAIEAFLQALEIKPDHQDALLLLAGQYLIIKEYCLGKALYEEVLRLNPDYNEAYYGLARAYVFLEEESMAEAYLWIFLSKEEDREEAWRLLASLAANDRRYTESEAIYRYARSLSGDEPAYRQALFDVLSHTRRSGFINGGSAEEKEKDQITGRWVASIRYINAEIGVVNPVSDTFRWTLKARSNQMRQRYIVRGFNQFNIRFDALSLKGEWFWSPHWTTTADVTVEYASNIHGYALLPTKDRVLIEPSLVFRYENGGDLVVFGEVTDSWVFRDFAHGKTIVFPRESALLSYKRTFGDNRFYGAAAAWIFYQDPINNQEQDLTAWIEAGLPGVQDNFSLGYYFIYRQFKEETTGYYSFEYEATHWLMSHLYKRWMNGFRADLQYWHGFRTTRGRNPQNQIVISPVESLFPVTTQPNQINQVFMTLGYNPSACLDMYITGSFYRDSFDYTVYGAKAALEWRF